MFDRDTTPEEIQIFLAETDEQLEGLDAGLLRLERTPGDAALLQEIFRIAHTIKGSSAAVGLDDMSRLTHAMESLLDGLRRGALSVSGAILDALLQSLDTLRVIAERAVNEDPSEVDVASLVQRLADLSTDGATLPVVAPAARPEPMPRATPGPAMRVTLSFDPSSPLLAARQYQVLTEFERWGEVLVSSPSREQLEEGESQPQLELELTTELSEPELLNLLESLPDVADAQVQRYDELSTPSPGSDGSAVEGQAAGLVGAEAGAGASNLAAATVRIDVQRLDNLMNLVGELVIDRTRLLELAGQLLRLVGKEGPVDDLLTVCGHIDRTTSNLRDEIMRSRMVPVANVFRRLPRLVRDVAQQSGKAVDLVIEGEDTELDRSVVDGIADPLIHLLRNAVDHGIETPSERAQLGKPRTGTIHLAARHEEGHIVIDIADDGAGIDPDRMRAAAVARGLVTRETADRMATADVIDLIFVPGFSTATTVTEVSGRGVGMDIVRNRLEAINGSIVVDTEPGAGTHFTLRLPLTLAIIRALLVRLSDRTFAIPLSSVVEVLRFPTTGIRHVNRRPVIDLRGEVLPIFRLAHLLDLPSGDNAPSLVRVVVSRASGRPVALIVDRLAGEQEIVIKSLGELVGQVRGIVGATILGDGHLCPILDVGALVGVHASAGMAEAANG